MRLRQPAPFEDTIAELEDVATAAGFRVVAAVAAVTEHSIVRRYGAGRPDEEDVRRLGGYADRIAERLAAGAAGPLSPLPGNRPYRESKRVGLGARADALVHRVRRLRGALSRGGDRGGRRAEGRCR